jgi:hypothetical protein
MPPRHATCRDVDVSELLRSMPALAFSLSVFSLSALQIVSSFLFTIDYFFISPIYFISLHFWFISLLLFSFMSA